MSADVNRDPRCVLSRFWRSSSVCRAKCGDDSVLYFFADNILYYLCILMVCSIWNIPTVTMTTSPVTRPHARRPRGAARPATTLSPTYLLSFVARHTSKSEVRLVYKTSWTLFSVRIRVCFLTLNNRGA